MNRYRIFTVIALAVLSIGSLFLTTGCANIIPPQGGLRDSLPPVILKVNPKDSATNFKENKINFYFDEYIDVQNVQENLIVSPVPVNPPVIEFKLREMTVKLKDSLLPNTTYSIEFGNAIKDFTEGNILKNPRFVFSTGAYMDSLEIAGRLVMAETGKADSTMLVILHTTGNDSAVVKSKPVYITRLDNKGRFVFKNLPAKKFYLYALKDEGGSKRYNGGSQLFAFADSAVTPLAKPDSIKLFAYAGKSTNNSLSASPAENKNKPTADKRLKYQTNLANGQQDLLTAFTFTFEQGLKKLDSNGIVLYTDSSYTAANYKIKKDSTAKILSIETEWEPQRLYHLVLTKDFAIDSLDHQLSKTDTITFSARKKSDYGSLKIKLRKLDLKQNPVLQFIQGEKVVQSVVLTGAEFSAELFQPGEYQLRILHDKNKNGVWDAGDFFHGRKQPEKVIPLDKKISVKSAWSNDYDIDIPLSL
jgi:hypothetical protein